MGIVTGGGAHNTGFLIDQYLTIPDGI